MDLKHMEIFVTSADIGSFKRAAEALGVTQPHVSKVIQDMETELGTELFEREGYGVVLSEAGKRIYGHACDILHSAELLKKTCVESDNRALCVSSVTDGRVSGIFARFCGMKRREKMRFRYLETTVEEVLGHVHRHVSEIGLVRIPQWRQAAFLRQLDYKKLEFVPVKQGNLCLRVGRQSTFYGLNSVESSVLESVDLAQAGEDYYSLTARPGRVRGERRPPLEKIRVAVNTNTDEAVVDILRHTDMGNINCTVFPERLSEEGLHTVRLIDLEETVCFGYVRQKSGRLSAEAAAFIRYLKEELAGGTEVKKPQQKI